MNRYFVPCCAAVLVLLSQAGIAQDQVGLSFSNERIMASTEISAGLEVKIYLLAIRSDPADGVTSFSCKVEWDDKVIKDLAWQAPVQVGHDGSIYATFAEARLPENGCIVLASAVGQVGSSECSAVQITNIPVVVGTVVQEDRLVPVDGTSGARLSLNCPQDPGPPGRPTNVILSPDGDSAIIDQ